jgi:hypothetical protein
MIWYRYFAVLCLSIATAEDKEACPPLESAAANVGGEALLQTKQSRESHSAIEALLTENSREFYGLDGSPSKDIKKDISLEGDGVALAPLQERTALEVCYGIGGYQGAPQCVPEKQEAENRQQMGLLATDANQTSVGEDAALTAEGFKETTSLCCPVDMEAFFNRLLDDQGYSVCSKEHVQGLVHWFTCVPDMEFQYVLDVIANGNPCKYWAPKGSTCPALSAECTGKFCGEPGQEGPVLVTNKPDESSVTFKPIAPGGGEGASATLPMTTATTTPSSCEGDVEFAFWDSDVWNNNLNSLGPDSGSEGLRVGDLGIDPVSGKYFDLLITTTDRYISNWADWNNVYGLFGYLTMNNNTAMDLMFTIVETNTSTPLVLNKFYFTFFDLDTSNPNGDQQGGKEILYVGGHTKHLLGPNTELAITENANDKGQTKYEATVFGESADNPTDPMAMSVQQQNRAVTFQFDDTSSFEMTYVSAPGGLSRGREVYFAGKSQLALLPCAGTAAAQKLQPFHSVTEFVPEEAKKIVDELFPAGDPGAEAASQPTPTPAPIMPR